MRSFHKTWLLNGAVVLSMISLMLLGFFALTDQFLEDAPSSLAESVRILQQEEETAQRLDELDRRLRESGRRTDQLIHDLIDQLCDLREAAARWREACLEVHLRAVDRIYTQGATKEERIILHLIHLVGKQLEQQPRACAEVLARLRLEKASLEAECAQRRPMS
jgi:hypothetical protein